MRRLWVVAPMLGAFGCWGIGGGPLPPDAATSPCQGVTCSGHGSCAQLAGAAACVCEAGYHAQGTTCAANDSRDPCAGVDCAAGGTCAVASGAALCVCGPHYHSTGATTCAADTDLCGGVTCSGHGTCAVASGAAVCFCATGYHASGLSCAADDPSDPCAGVDCGPGGTCAVASGAALCVCGPNHHLAGPTTCAADVDPCQSVSCSGHGTCAVSAGATLCICALGYHAQGLTCHSDGSPDAGSSSDAGSRPDAGSHADAGAVSDAGASLDAGTVSDAGAPPRPDAGSPGGPDAGAPPDASADASAAVADRPYLFKADEARLRASIAAGDPEAVGSASNDNGQPLGFLTLAKAAQANRASYNDIPTWQLAFAGWLLDDVSLQRLARDEAMAVVSASPSGDTGHSSDYQHVEERLLTVAATADLCYAQLSSSQLGQVATWVNGTLSNWHEGNLTYWPWDEALNNYWQNGFLATVIGGVATEGFNAQAASWRAKAEEMAAHWTESATPPAWTGPVQSEGHYYAGYVNHAFWAMELYDRARGTHLLATSQFSPAQQLDLLMFQTRPHLLNFFEVGSEASASEAPFTVSSMAYWQHLIHSSPEAPQARQAKGILGYVLSDRSTFWARAFKGFHNFYWSLRRVPSEPLSAKADRLYVAPSAGIVGARSSAGFQTSARAAVMFANQMTDKAAYSHGNPDAPGFQWASGADWLVTDPEYYSSSGILAEAGGALGSDLSNIVTLAGVKFSGQGGLPNVVFAEDHLSSAVSHVYVQIDAQPYWTSASVYRRDYVWLDDLQVVAVFDRVVAPAAKTFRLHVPASPAVSGSAASYTVGGKAVAVRNLLPAGATWASQNLNGSITSRDVWRLTQTDPASDYTSLKVFDLGARVSSATVTSSSGHHDANLTVGGVGRTIRFFDDGSHAQVQ